MLTNPGSLQEVKSAGHGDEVDVEGRGRLKVRRAGGAIHYCVPS